MTQSKQSLPPIHYRHGVQTMNSRDLAKCFNRGPHEVNAIMKRLIERGIAKESDAHIIKASGYHRFDSYDLSIPLVRQVVTAFRKPGDALRRSALLAALGPDPAIYSASSRPDIEDVIERRDEGFVITSINLSLFLGMKNTEVLQLINFAVQENPMLRADLWEIAPKPGGDDRRAVQVGAAVVDAVRRLTPPGDAQTSLEGLVAALSVRPAEAPQTAPAPLVIVEESNGRRIVNSHVLARLLDEKHKVVRNAITSIATHDVWFTSRVFRSAPRGESLGRTFDLDRDAVIRVLREFGPTKRERVMPAILAAFDGGPAPAAPPTLAPEPVSTPAPARTEMTLIERRRAALVKARAALAAQRRAAAEAAASPPAPSSMLDVDVDRTVSHPVVYRAEDDLRASSLDVAGYFERKHFHVMRDIDAILAQAGDGIDLSRNFVVLTEPHPTIPKQTVRSYAIDEKGLMILVGRFTGAKALAKQIAYADEFARMRALLQSSPTPSIEAIVQDPAAFVALFDAYRLLKQSIAGGGVSPASLPTLPAPAPRRRRVMTNLNMTSTAQALGLKLRDLKASLIAHRFFDMERRPLPSSIARGIFVVQTGVGHNGTNYEQVRVTPKGLRILREELLR